MDLQNKKRNLTAKDLIRRERQDKLYRKVMNQDVQVALNIVFDELFVERLVHGNTKWETSCLIVKGRLDNKCKIIIEIGE